MNDYGLKAGSFSPRLKVRGVAVAVPRLFRMRASLPIWAIRYERYDLVSDLCVGTALPHPVVIDASGKVSAVIDGYHADATLDQAVQAALAK